MTPANGFSGAYQRAGPLVNAAALLREFGVAPAEMTQGLDLTNPLIFPGSP